MSADEKCLRNMIYKIEGCIHKYHNAIILLSMII